MQGEREGDPSSSQSLLTTVACPVVCFSSLPVSQQKLNQNQHRVPLWTCERKRELRSRVEVEQLLRGKGEGAGMSGKKTNRRNRTERERRRRKTGRRREGTLPNCPYNLDPKGMGHVVSSPLLLKPWTENDEGVPKKNWPKTPKLVVMETKTN